MIECCPFCGSLNIRVSTNSKHPCGIFCPECNTLWLIAPKLDGADYKKEMEKR